MAIYHLSYVVCDRCGNPAPCGDDVAEARAIARNQGWERRNWNVRIKDVCPNCITRTPRVEETPNP